MLTLRPGEQFYIYWIPADPADSTTYYPQSTIVYASSGALITTVNLTQSNGSYVGSFQVPQDVTGLGMYIIQTMKVYTDSGHTTLDTTYQQEQITYKVKDDVRNLGGGSEINYDFLKEMVSKIVGEAIATIKFEQKETDLSKLEKMLKKVIETQDPHGYALSNISGVLDELKGKKIDFPKGEYEKHFNGLHERVSNLEKQVEVKYASIESTIKKYFNSRHIEDHEAFNKSHKELNEKIDEYLTNIMDEMRYRFENVDSMVYKKGYEVEEKPKDKKIDYLELAKNLI